MNDRKGKDLVLLQPISAKRILKVVCGPGHFEPIIKTTRENLKNFTIHRYIILFWSYTLIQNLTLAASTSLGDSDTENTVDVLFLSSTGGGLLPFLKEEYIKNYYRCAVIQVNQSTWLVLKQQTCNVLP